MNLYKDITGKGTYKTYANAEKRIEDVRKEFGVPFRYIIAATTDGRFFPVVVLLKDQQYYAGTLAHYGVCVTF